MLEVVEIGLGIACGAWSASNLAHAGLIMLVILAPVIAWRDFSTHRIPESISLPWLAFALTIAVFRLPASGTALIGTAITAVIIFIMTFTGIVNRKHVIGFADVVVHVAILATLSDDRTFPAPNSFMTMAMTIIVAALVALAINAILRRPLSAPGPIGGSLAIGAVLVAVPAWLLAR